MKAHPISRSIRRRDGAGARRAAFCTRPNLTVLTGVTVDKIRIKGGRAVSLDYAKDGKRHEALAAREIILSSGAVGSPAILERSGIGDGAKLQALGIETVNHLPGVGENLQDHLQIRPIFKVHGIKTLNSEYRNLFRRAMMGVDYALRRRGPLTMAPSQVGAFVRSNERVATANLEFHFQPLSLDDWGKGLHPFGAFTASVCNLRPTSRGSIHLSSTKPEDAPSIRPNYLSTEEDRQVAVESLEWARRIVFQKPLEPYKPEEYKPGAHVTAHGDLVKAAGELGTTIFHPVGTAKMGTEDDKMAVLDARLRVRGIRGLRVVDASVMPTITSGNTNSPTIMIAEKASRMIIEDAKG